MEESNETVIKVKGEDEGQDTQLIVIKPEKMEMTSASASPSSQKTDTSTVKVEDDQVNLKCDPKLQSNLIEDAEIISSEEDNEDDDLEDISDDEDDNFEEGPPEISEEIPSTSSSTEKSEDKQNTSNTSDNTSLPNGYYNPLIKNEEDLQNLIKSLKEDPKVITCYYCWRIGHVRINCTDKLWYSPQLNKQCSIWMEGCSKRKQVYLEMRPEFLEREKERKRNLMKRWKMNKKLRRRGQKGKEEGANNGLPPGDEFEVVEELESSDEEDEQPEKLQMSPSPSSSSPPPPPTQLFDSRENLILKNEEDLKYLRECLTEVDVMYPLTPSKKICNFCFRGGHIWRDCQDRRISGAVKLCPIWRQGFEERKQTFLELEEGATEKIKERRRLANQRRKVTKKAKKLKRLEEERERREMEETVKRQKLEDEEKRRKIEAAEMLLEIVNELLE